MERSPKLSSIEGGGNFDAKIDADIAAMQEEEIDVSVSRRNFLRLGGVVAIGALATGLPLDESKAEIIEKRYTPEQQRNYQTLVVEMRESARTSLVEDKSYFIARPDGSSESRKLATIARTEAGYIESPGRRVFGLTTDPGLIVEMEEEIREGAIVEDIHTHPTEAMLRSAQLTREFLDQKHISIPDTGVDRVPPSPNDILYAIARYHSLGEDAVRARFSIVTEAGIWNYGPNSIAAAEKLRRALDSDAPTLRLIDTKYISEARELANYMRIVASETSNSDSSRMEILRVAEMIEKRTFIDTLMGRPLSEEDLAMFDTLVLNTNIPQGARRYIRVLQRAVKESHAAMHKIAPTLEGPVDALPEAERFDQYIERWNQLGIKMQFASF